MKVKFKLSPDQLVRALEEAARVADDMAGWGPEAIASGNLCWYWVTGLQNPAQYMDVDAEASTLIYRGERNPLVQDGGLQALRRIAGLEGLEALQVVEYVSTMPEMAWWETREDLALRQVAACRDLSDVVRVIGPKPGNRCWYSWQQGAAYAALERFPGPEYSGPGTAEYRRLSASGELANATARLQLQAMWD